MLAAAAESERLELTDTQIRYLFALCLAYERDGRATVRTVAAMADRSVAQTHKMLGELAEAGFVALGVRGALRPLVRIR